MILRSPVRTGASVRSTRRAALARPGVHAVITAADIGTEIPVILLRLDVSPAFKPFEQPVIAHGKVRYVGEPVAVVLADSAAAAEDALDAIALDIEALPAVVDRAAAASNDVLLVEAAGTNLPLTLTGAAATPMRRSRRALHAPRTFQRATPRRGADGAARAHGGMGRRARPAPLYGAAKVAFANRRVLAQLMGLPEGAIRMVENDVGGGFGARGEFYPEDFLIPFAARLTGRPVNGSRTAASIFTTNHAREADCELEIACDRDGTILALRGRVSTDQGAYIRTNGATPARNIAQVLAGPYRIPHVRIDVALAMTNKTPVGTYRGPGRFEADFFRERLFDIAAGELGIERAAFRRRNLIAEAEPLPAPDRRAARDRDRDRQRRLPQHLDRCLQEIDWTGKAALQGKLIDGRYRGTPSAATSKVAPPARKRTRAWRWRPTARSRSMSAPPRSARDWRPCAPRSPPTRWSCR